MHSRQSLAVRGAQRPQEVARKRLDLCSMRPVVRRRLEIAIVLAFVATHAPLERATAAVLNVVHPEVGAVVVVAIARDPHEVSRAGRRVQGTPHRLAILHPTEDSNAPVALAEMAHDVVQPQTEAIGRRIEAVARLQVHAIDALEEKHPLHHALDSNTTAHVFVRIRSDLRNGRRGGVERRALRRFGVDRRGRGEQQRGHHQPEHFDLPSRGLVTQRTVPRSRLSSRPDGLPGTRAACESAWSHRGREVNSQNRMNAGAEYVLYRILRALQDQEGIHPESLLTCLGALAGYACRHVHGDALHRALADSPMSVRALVRRAVQKLGKPLPDFDEIDTHVMRTVGTRAFGVPRVTHEHRPHRPAIVYLEQLWPQILPIAQRFCRRPAQLPVLFGIAVQRAIEVTQNLLSPTVSASIAMECAVAMSRVALPGEAFGAQAAIARSVPLPVATATRSNPPPTPIAAALGEIRAERRTRGAVEATPRNVWARVASRPAATLVTVVFLAVVTVAGAKWTTGGADAPKSPRAERKLQVAQVQDRTTPFAPPSQKEASAIPKPQTAQAAEPSEPAPIGQDADSPVPTSAEAAELRLNEESQRQLDANATGDSEMLPSMEVSPSPPPPSAVPADSLF